jgi:hypothetical protein
VQGASRGYPAWAGFGHVVLVSRDLSHTENMHCSDAGILIILGARLHSFTSSCPDVKWSVFVGHRLRGRRLREGDIPAYTTGYRIAVTARLAWRGMLRRS